MASSRRPATKKIVPFAGKAAPQRTMFEVVVAARGSTPSVEEDASAGVELLNAKQIATVSFRRLEELGNAPYHPLNLAEFVVRFRRYLADNQRFVEAWNAAQAASVNLSGDSLVAAVRLLAETKEKSDA